MRFHLIDRIVEIEVGKRIQAVKHLTVGEEYLADHFPTFPVMPGVLMLQALVEAGSWLLRATDDFQHSVICLREAKNVKYGNFVQPGKSLNLTMEMVDYSPESSLTTFKGNGMVDGGRTVSAKLTLNRYRLQDANPDLQTTDEELTASFRRQFHQLTAQTLQP